MAELSNPYLVETEWLQAHLADANLRLFDVTSGQSALKSWSDQLPAREAYRAAHIPGARYLDIQADISDNDAPAKLTHLAPQRQAAAFGKLGIRADSAVVVYSSAGYGWATRVWWQLRDIGFTRVAVLNGGLAKWLAEGRPTDSGDVAPHPQASLEAIGGQALFASLEDVERVVSGESHALLVNALAPAQFRGEVAVAGDRRGHIPGSVNLPQATLIDAETNTFHPWSEVRSAVEALPGAGKAEETITYCAGGIAATVDAFALHALGAGKVRVYDGSLAEWVLDAGRPLTISAGQSA